LLIASWSASRRRQALPPRDISTAGFGKGALAGGRAVLLGGDGRAVDVGRDDFRDLAVVRSPARSGATGRTGRAKNTLFLRFSVSPDRDAEGARLARVGNDQKPPELALSWA